jgi:hypothetical protein
MGTDCQTRLRPSTEAFNGIAEPERWGIPERVASAEQE